MQLASKRMKEEEWTENTFHEGVNWCRDFSDHNDQAINLSQVLRHTTYCCLTTQRTAVYQHNVLLFHNTTYWCFTTQRTAV